MAKKKKKGKAEKEPAVSSECKIIFPFYSNERWNNWINQVKESGFELKEDDEDAGKSGEIFVNMEDDIILACLKVIAKFDGKELSPDGAFDALTEIRDVVLIPIDPISESIDLMIDSLQTSLIGVFASCEYYIDKGADNSVDLVELVKNAISSEENNDPGTALSYIAALGANVLKGAEISDEMIEDLPYGLVAEWMDGLDSLAVAMMGDDSYKFDEPDE
jgi:hypothetical protein